MAGTTFFSSNLSPYYDSIADHLPPADLKMLRAVGQGLRLGAQQFAPINQQRIEHLALRLLWDAQQELLTAAPEQATDLAFKDLPIDQQRERLWAKLRTKDFSPALRANNFEGFYQTALATLTKPCDDSSPRFVRWALRQLEVDFDRQAPGFMAYEYLVALNDYILHLERYRENVQMLWQKKQLVAAGATAPTVAEIQDIEDACQRLKARVEAAEITMGEKGHTLMSQEAVDYLKSLRSSVVADACLALHEQYKQPLDDIFAAIQANQVEPAEPVFPETDSQQQSLAHEIEILETEIVSGYQATAEQINQMCYARARANQGSTASALSSLLNLAPQTARGSITQFFEHVCRELHVAPHDLLFSHSFSDRDAQGKPIGARLPIQFTLQHDKKAVSSLADAGALAFKIKISSDEISHLDPEHPLAKLFEGETLSFHSERPLEFLTNLHALLDVHPNGVLHCLHEVLAQQLYPGCAYHQLDAAQAASVQLYSNAALQHIQRARGVTQAAQAEARIREAFYLKRAPQAHESLYDLLPAVTEETTLGELPGFSALLQDLESIDEFDKNAGRQIKETMVQLVALHRINGSPSDLEIRLAMNAMAEHLKSHNRAVFASNPKALGRAVLSEFAKVSLKRLSLYGHQDNGQPSKEQREAFAAHPFAPENRYMLLSDVEQAKFIQDHSLRTEMRFTARPGAGKSQVTAGPAGELKKIEDIKAALQERLFARLKDLYPEDEAKAQAEQLLTAYWNALTRQEKQILERKEEGPVGAHAQLLENMVTNLGSVELDKRALQAYLKRLEAECQRLAALESAETVGRQDDTSSVSGFTDVLRFTADNKQLTRKEFVKLVSAEGHPFKPQGYEISKRELLAGERELYNLWGLTGGRPGGYYTYSFCVKSPEGKKANLQLSFDQSGQEGYLKLITSKGSLPTDNEVFLLVKMTLHNAKKDQKTFEFTGKAGYTKEIFKQFAKELLRQRPDAVVTCKGAETAKKYNMSEKVTADEQKKWLAEVEEELREEYRLNMLASEHGMALASPHRVAHHREPYSTQVTSLFPAPQPPPPAIAAPVAGLQSGGFTGGFIVNPLYDSAAGTPVSAVGAANPWAANFNQAYSGDESTGYSSFFLDSERDERDERDREARDMYGSLPGGQGLGAAAGAEPDDDVVDFNVSDFAPMSSDAEPLLGRRTVRQSGRQPATAPAKRPHFSLGIGGGSRGRPQATGPSPIPMHALDSDSDDELLTP